jgi:hypothetical protein
MNRQHYLNGNVNDLQQSRAFVAGLCGTKTLETKPKSASYWSTQDMAKATGLSQSTITRIWRTFGLKPHRTETFKLSDDPFFIGPGCPG